MIFVVHLPHGENAFDDEYGELEHADDLCKVNFVSVLKCGSIESTSRMQTPADFCNAIARCGKLSDTIFADYLCGQYISLKHAPHICIKMSLQKDCSVLFCSVLF